MAHSKKSNADETIERDPIRAAPGRAEVGPELPTPQRWLLFKLAAGLAGAWVALLIGMYLTTANPLVISRDQIVEADAVVTGHVVGQARDRIRIDRVWSGGNEAVAAGREIAVLNLAEALAARASSPSDALYIIPLSGTGERHRVTTLERQQAPPLIYLASPEAQSELRDVMISVGKRPHK